MNDEELRTIEQVKQFLEGSEALKFGGVSLEERYRWIETVLVRFKYYRLKRVEKGVIRRYIEKVSGYSRAQVSRLIRHYNQRGRLRKTHCKRHRFPRKYTLTDIALLAKTDELHDCLKRASHQKDYGTGMGSVRAFGLQEYLTNICCPSLQSAPQSPLREYNQAIYPNQTGSGENRRAGKT